MSILKSAERLVTLSGLRFEQSHVPCIHTSGNAVLFKKSQWTLRSSKSSPHFLPYFQSFHKYSHKHFSNMYKQTEMEIERLPFDMEELTKEALRRIEKLKNESGHKLQIQTCQTHPVQGNAQCWPS